MRAQQTLFIIWFSDTQKKNKHQMDRKWKKQENFSRQQTTKSRKLQSWHLSVYLFIYLTLWNAYCVYDFNRCGWMGGVNTFYSMFVYVHTHKHSRKQEQTFSTQCSPVMCTWKAKRALATFTQTPKSQHIY